MLDKLKQYIHTYDPSHFSFYYTVKSIIALCISVFLAHFFNLTYHIIFTVLSSIFIFYINVFDSTGFKKAFYLALFIFNSCCFVCFVGFFNYIGVFFVIPTFIWVFWVGISSQISQDLFKINIYSTILSFSVFTFSQSKMLVKEDAIFAIIIGGIVALLFRTVSFYTYGAYTKRSFLLLLNDLEFMAKKLNDREFDTLNTSFITHLNQIKTVFKSKSVKIKDPSFIKHHNLAIFYLYKCEEIGAMLLSLYNFFKHNKTNSHILNIQDEIGYNIKELKKIFLDGEKPILCKKRYENVKKLDILPRLCDLMEVMFFKFELFVQGGQIVLPQTLEKSNIFDVKNKIISAFKNKEAIRLSIKTALSVSLGVFIALFFELDHGIWVAVGVFSLIRARKNSTKVAMIQTFIGLMSGFFVGYVLILLFMDTIFFVPIVFISYFGCIYFKHFPQTISTASIMANLALFFAFSGADFQKLILYRIIDFGISFLIVLFVSWFIWPSKSEDEIMPSIFEILKKQSDLLNTKDSNDYLRLQNELSLSLNNFSILISECKSKKNYYKILQILSDLNSCIMSLCSYLNSVDEFKDFKTLSDIRLLSARFDMIDNMANTLPYYFYDEVRSKLSSKNPKLIYFLLLVAKKQDELYKNIKTLI